MALFGECNMSTPLGLATDIAYEASQGDICGYGTRGSGLIKMWLLEKVYVSVRDESEELQLLCNGHTLFNGKWTL